MKKLINIVAVAAAIALVVTSVYIANNNATCSNCSTPRYNKQDCASFVACQMAQRNFCAEAERAADRRISFWQDPSVSEELDREYEELKRLCLEQNPGYVFEEEGQLPAQEMTEISF